MHWNSFLLPNLLQSSGIAIMGTFIPVSLRTAPLAENQSIVGVVLALIGIGRVLADPLSSSLSARLGGGLNLMVISGFIATLGVAVLGVWPDVLWAYFVSQVVAGASLATFATPRLELAQTLDKPTRNILTGLIGAGARIGFVVGPIVGGLLYYHISPRYAYICAAVFVLLSTAETFSSTILQRMSDAVQAIHEQYAERQRLIAGLTASSPGFSNNTAGFVNANARRGSELDDEWDDISDIQNKDDDDLHRPSRKRPPPRTSLSKTAAAAGAAPSSADPSSAAFASINIDQNNSIQEVTAPNSSDNLSREAASATGGGRAAPAATAINNDDADDDGDNHNDDYQSADGPNYGTITSTAADADRMVRADSAFDHSSPSEAVMAANDQAQTALLARKRGVPADQVPGATEEQAQAGAAAATSSLRDIWPLILRVGLLAFSVTGLRGARRLLLTFRALDLQYNAAQVGFVVSGSFSIDAVLFFLTSMVANRFGYRAAAIPLLIMYGAAFLVMSFDGSASPTTLFVSAGLFGLADSFGTGLMLAVFASHLPRSALGPARMFVDAGVLAGPLLAGVLAHAIELSWTSRALAIWSFVTALLVPVLIPQTATASEKCCC